MTYAEELEQVRLRAHREVERRIGIVNRHLRQDGRADREILGIPEVPVPQIYAHLAVIAQAWQDGLVRAFNSLAAALRPARRETGLHPVGVRYTPISHPEHNSVGRKPTE